MSRPLKLIHSIIQKLDLDLGGLNVLTEVGSNHYIYTPVIARLSGASKVYAWCRDSRFGQAADIISACRNFCELHGIDHTDIVFAANERPVSHIEDVDIVTNLGFVRPLDDALLSSMKKDAVIPYMCEAWELREEDINLALCRENGIRVAGTWENHPDLMIFNACGTLAAKVCFEAGFEIYQNKILIFSDDAFGETAANTFKAMGAEQVTHCRLDELHKIDAGNYDFIYLADYGDRATGFSENLVKNFGHLQIPVVHLCGEVNYDLLTGNGSRVYPARDGHNKRMTFALDYLGPKPIIELHAAGLKVGELLHKRTDHPLCQHIIS